MSDLQSQDYVRRSASTMTPPSARSHEDQVAKLIDVSRCIGCKACQSACMEWNNLRPEIGHFEGSYENPMDLGPSVWTLMKFAEYENEQGNLEWLIRKDGCMHCEDPGCLKACPAPGAIVCKAYVTKRIKPMNVDGKPTHVIGVPLHWGFTGQARKGYGANTLTPSVRSEERRVGKECW